MQKPLDAKLPAIRADVARGNQVAERQHGGEQRREDIELQTGGDSPVFVLKIAVGFEWQEAIAIDDHRVVEQIGHHQTAGFKLADLRTGERGNQCCLPRVRVEGSLIISRR